MNLFTLNTKKATLLIAPFLALSTQNAMAISAYNTDTAITYSISSTGTDGLSINDSRVSFDNQSSFNSSSSAKSNTEEYFSALDTEYTQLFHAEDSINGDSFASSEYWWDYSISFSNGHASNSYDVTVDYSYNATAEANGEYGYSFIDSGYYNEDDSDFDDTFFLEANTNESNPDSFSGSIIFTLAAGQSETYYFDIGTGGDLESTASPVPVPAAVWLFSSALAGLSGFRKFKFS